MNIDVINAADWWNVRIDARSGAFIEKNNWTVHEGEDLETDAVETGHNQPQLNSRNF